MSELLRRCHVLTASPSLRLAALALLLAFAFLGSRGIWDPDEGRYTNVALQMLDSGDWVHPKRHHETGHWTKPPLTYWTIAASIAGFGPKPWAARLPAALSYLLCTLLAWRIARRLLPGREDRAGLVYATMLLPFGAASLITTDFLLAACETLAMWAFVEARFAASGRRGLGWMLLLWVALALAFLTKGPPGLLPLAVMLLFNLLAPGPQRRSVMQWSGLALFVLLALPWYVAVILGTPGLLDYFVGDEIYNRIATDHFNRNGQWYGWLWVYAPTLLLGSLPWTRGLLGVTGALPGQLRRWWREPAARDADAPLLLLTVWLLLPLLVFCLSRSRLPLYLLPLFVPLALLIAARSPAGAPLRWRWLLLWAVVVLGLRLASAGWPTHKDASAWAEAIRERAPFVVREVVFVDDMARYGLHLELGTEIERIYPHPLPRPQPRFNPGFDADLAQELAEREPDVLWICKQALWPSLQARIAELGYHAQVLGEPYEGRVMFVVTPASTLPAPADRDG
ncbi:glycosyltransferase [Pseudoxanthomonas kalamensis DSM 18571]|uniref:ArnT family glycosyltransferase n=1 Tax=Pseudoxanthomonas kalamensis TaxID=289483 RepID=UPI0013911090|nr:glycosyltransferase family 39 protein [Pseudoxanthomonas kalamensis]KAF1712394.1 glycosyltransferase [Pseudoxanthomonas kalamensis DSM 18571]